MFNVFVNVGVDQVYCVINIGFDVFEWIVFCCWYDFGCGGVNYKVDVIECFIEFFLIMNIIYEEVYLWIILEFFCYFLLFYFVLGVDYKMVGIEFGKGYRYECMVK